MRTLNRFALILLSVVVLLPAQISAQVYVGRPKMIVLVVIDQFRGDYLMRDRDKFKGEGFKLFLDRGAWFTDCYYDYANTKTAPGHATIGTGAYSNGHGIEANEFWDATRSWSHPVSSVEDERYRPVDLPAGAVDSPKALIGSSPRNLRATTLGDELRLATQGRSRVYGISLKDRAAILPSGQTANAAYWINGATGQFTTSTYYMEHLPVWVKAFNAGGRPQQAVREAGAEEGKPFFRQVGAKPAANSYELDFAKALIEGEKLGQNGVTDLLVVSLSANDLMGHKYGPDSPEEEQMILSLDRDLDGFFHWLDKTVGLDNVWIALTADHGVAPVAAQAASLGVNAAQVDAAKLYADLNASLNERFSPGEKSEFLLPRPDFPYIILDRRAFEKLKIDQATAERTAVELLPAALAKQAPASAGKESSFARLAPTPRLAAVYTSEQLKFGQYPANELGHLLAHSYVDRGEWFVMAILDAYQLPGGGGATHFAPWSYDRHVPLAFFGDPFKPGEYHGRVEPVDLAATLASLAGVNQPSAAVGRVLTEALKPIPAQR
jgi:hypothetical protein